VACSGTVLALVHNILLILFIDLVKTGLQLPKAITTLPALRYFCSVDSLLLEIVQAFSSETQRFCVHTFAVVFHS
jgi:hypothetical protein